MVTTEQFIDHWSEYGTLSKFDTGVLQIVDLPLPAKEFLRHAGLPTSEHQSPPMTRIYPTLPRVQEIYNGPCKVDTNAKDLRTFGSNVVFDRVLSFYCVEEPTGKVYKTVNRIPSQLKAIFMNSSIEQFAEFILILQKYYKWERAQVLAAPQPNIAHVDRDAVANMTKQAAQQLCDCDPEACAEAKQALRSGSLITDDDLPQLAWTERILQLEYNQW